jgi:hypothetical protein
VQPFGPFDLLSHGVGNHAPVAHKDNFFQAELALQLLDLFRHGGGVWGVTGKNVDSNRTTLCAAEQGNDHLFVTPFAISIVAEGNKVALGVGSFEVAARDIVEHQVTILKMTSCQGALNGALALQEPIHRQITMEVHIDFAFHAGQFPQRGVFPLVGERQLAAGIYRLPKVFSEKSRDCREQFSVAVNTVSLVTRSFSKS